MKKTENTQMPSRRGELVIIWELSLLLFPADTSLDLFSGIGIMSFGEIFIST